MALEHDTQTLFNLYNSDPKIKGYIDSLPQERWLPELQRLYDNRHPDTLTTIFRIAAATILFAGLYLV